MLGQLRSSIFCDVPQRRLLETGVSVQPVGLIFKIQADKENIFMGCLIFEDGLTRNGGKYLSRPFNIPEMPIYHVHRGGSVRSRVLRYFLNSDEHLSFPALYTLVII
jgi:hypothetical protein